VARIVEFIGTMRTKGRIARYQGRRVIDEIATRGAREHVERQEAGIKDTMPNNDPGAAG
jgi:hypothetical protein